MQSLVEGRLLAGHQLGLFGGDDQPLADIDEPRIVDVVGGDDGLDRRAKSLGDAVQRVARHNDIDRWLLAWILGARTGNGQQSAAAPSNKMSEPASRQDAPPVPHDLFV